VLSIGISEGMPWVSAGGYRVSARQALGAGEARLAISFIPVDEGMRVLFYLDSLPAGEGLLGALPSALGVAVRTVIAGPEGYPAVYSSVTAMEGAYPAYRLAALSSRGADLLVASGFEGGEAGPGIQPVGQVTLSDGSATLERGSLLLLDPAAGGPSEPLEFSWTVSRGAVELVMPLSGGGSLSVSSQGVVSVDGRMAGTIRTLPGATVSVAPSGTGITVASGDSSLDLPGLERSAAASLLVLPSGSGPAVLTKLLVTTARTGPKP